MANRLITAAAMRGRYSKGGKVEQQIEISNREYANAITTVQKDSMVQMDLRIRKLTPKECWRLMGFDDEDFEKAEAVNSNTQLYKQAGNSIVVDVLEHLIKGVIDMRLWTDNPERDAEMHYEDTKPKKIGVCEHCSDPIYDYEEHYEIHGDMIHDDCLRDWAEQYKVS